MERVGEIHVPNIPNKDAVKVDCNRLIYNCKEVIIKGIGRNMRIFNLCPFSVQHKFILNI
jgi:hypothetical protein